MLPQIERVEIYLDEGEVFFDFHRAKGTTAIYPNRHLIKVGGTIEEALTRFHVALRAAYEKMQEDDLDDAGL